jgi:4-hydroxy-tetrahydrodipicolinate reductase
VRLLLFGHEGKVGQALRPALEAAGHEVVGVGRGDAADPGGVDAAVDFTEAKAARANVAKCLEAGVPSVVGTTGLGDDDLAVFDERARTTGVPCLVAANFAVGAVLMMRFAEEAARLLPRAEIVEIHHESKRDAPSGTAKETAARLPGEPPIHSVRLPGVVAHQEVLLGGPGQLLTIRHDALSREAFAPGVLLALERLGSLPPGVTLGIDGLFAR